MKVGSDLQEDRKKEDGGYIRWFFFTLDISYSPYISPNSTIPPNPRPDRVYRGPFEHSVVFKIANKVSILIL